MGRLFWTWDQKQKSRISWYFIPLCYAENKRRFECIMLRQFRKKHLNYWHVINIIRGITIIMMRWYFCLQGETICEKSYYFVYCY